MVAFPVLALGLAASSHATYVPRAAGVRSGFVSFPIQRTEQSGSASGINRRDNSVTLLNATQITYLIELEIGTPAQKTQVVLDTGSFELWVGPTCEDASTSDQIRMCQKAGSYNVLKSSTAVDQDSNKELAYGKGSASIEYYSDTIAIPGSNNTAMKNVTFGMATSTTDLTFGIAGIGHGNGFNTQYNNLVDELAAHNITSGRHFSVALGSKDASNGGVIIFGGIDTKKFAGPLVQFDNLPARTEGTDRRGKSIQGPERYWIQMDSVGVSKPGSGSSKAYPNSGLAVVLDTGSTMSYLPQSIIDKLGSDLGGKSAGMGLYEVPCSVASQPGTVDFAFGSLTVQVPYHEIVWEVLANQCLLAISPSGSLPTPLLGDSFLRSAYVVMDQDNAHIYLAQYSNCGQSEKTFVSSNNYTGDCTWESPSKKSAGVRETGVNMAALLGVGLAVQLAMALL